MTGKIIEACSDDPFFGKPPVPSSPEPHTQAFNQMWRPVGGDKSPKTKLFSHMRTKSPRMCEALSHVERYEGAESESGFHVGSKSAKVVHQFSGAAGVKTKLDENSVLRRHFHTFLNTSDIHETIFNAETPVTARTWHNPDPAGELYEGAAGKRLNEGQTTQRRQTIRANRSSPEQTLVGFNADHSMKQGTRNLKRFEGAAGKHSTKEVRCGTAVDSNRPDYARVRASSTPVTKPRWR